MWVRIPLAWFINLNNIKIVKHLQKKKSPIKNIRYSIKLTSIFSPSFISSSSLRVNVYSNGTYLKNNKIMIKQSYMILAWLSYLSKIGSDEITNKTNKDKKIKTPLFFVCPIKQTKITTLKTPMAHKTFSQEQFQFRFYSFSISFNLQKNINTLNINTLNKSLFLALMIRQNFINFSTNMLFLKKFKGSLPVKDIKYLKL